MVRSGVAGCGLVRYGKVGMHSYLWFGKVRLGTVWQGMVWLGAAWPG